VVLYLRALKNVAEDLERPSSKPVAKIVQNFHKYLYCLQTCKNKAGGHFHTWRVFILLLWSYVTSIHAFV